MTDFKRYLHHLLTNYSFKIIYLGKFGKTRVSWHVCMLHFKHDERTRYKIKLFSFVTDFVLVLPDIALLNSGCHQQTAYRQKKVMFICNAQTSSSRKAPSTEQQLMNAYKRKMMQLLYTV